MINLMINPNRTLMSVFGVETFSGEICFGQFPDEDVPCICLVEVSMVMGQDNKVRLVSNIYSWVSNIKGNRLKRG